MTSRVVLGIISTRIAVIWFLWLFAFYFHIIYMRRDRVACKGSTHDLFVVSSCHLNPEVVFEVSSSYRHVKDCRVRLDQS